MSNVYRSREGTPNTTVDTKTQLTTLGSQTAPGALLVPGAARFLRAAYIAASSSLEAAGPSGFIVRLEGPGIARGVFNVCAGAVGVPVATGGNYVTPSKRVPINIPVTPGQEILIFCEAVGTDSGTYQAAVTLEFGSEAGPEGEIKSEITLEGDLTAVDTLVRITAQGSVTSPSRLTPPDATMLKRLVVAVAHDGQADGEASFILRIGGDAVKGGEQTLVIGAGGRVAVQSGSDAAPDSMAPMILDNLDIEVAPNETLDISAEMTGVDVGTATVVVTAMFV